MSFNPKECITKVSDNWVSLKIIQKRLRTAEKYFSEFSHVLNISEIDTHQ